MRESERALAPDKAHLKELLKGIAHWNAWRAENPEVAPCFRGLDFTDAAIFAGSPLWQAASGEGRERKRGDRVVLNEGNFAGCDFRSANFRGVEMMDCDFRNASLVFANLEDTDPWDCDIRGANLSGANLRNADFGGVI